MTSERLQAVIHVSALTSGKFYQLPPDKENPGSPYQGFYYNKNACTVVGKIQSKGREGTTNV